MLQYCASTYVNYTIDIVQQVIVSPNDVIASLFKNGDSSFVKVYSGIIMAVYVVQLFCYYTCVTVGFVLKAIARWRVAF